MKREVTLTEFLCDGCGKVRMGGPDGDLAYGYHGEVTHIDGAGGLGGAFYACSERCIRKAVARGLEIEAMNPDEFAEAAKWR